jgi:hypothetical protein
MLFSTAITIYLVTLEGVGTRNARGVIRSGTIKQNLESFMKIQTRILLSVVFLLFLWLDLNMIESCRTLIESTLAVQTLQPSDAAYVADLTVRRSATKVMVLVTWLLPERCRSTRTAVEIPFL